MAINFLNTVNLNKNQLNQAAIENLGTDPATGVLGQIYYNLTDSALKICITASTAAPSNAVWQEVGTTSGVETITSGDGTASTGEAITVNTSAIGDVTLDVFKYAGGSNVGYVPEGGSVGKYLDGAGNWLDVTTGDITAVLQGTYINIDNSTGPEPTINHDLTTRTNTTSNDSPGYAGDFEVVDSVTTNTTGHVTAINTSTITLPSDTNETYTLPVAAGASNSAIMNLTAGGTGSGIKSAVTIFGTTGRIAITEQTGNNGSITVDLPDDVTIVNDLTIGGELVVSGTGISSFAGAVDMASNKLTNVATGTAGTDGVNLGQVELLVAGVGVFQGGYDASTNPGTPAVSGGSNVALDQGDYFVVTAGGDITFSDTTVTVEVGDFIFANAAITASSTPASTQYTIVIADDNIATANTTAANTQKGVAGFDSAYFDVTTGADAGWVQLNSQRNPYGVSQTLDNTSPVVRAESGGLTTFTIDLADASLFGIGALAKNVTAEVTQNVSPYQTVYADVTRSGSASMSIVFSGSVSVDIYRVLLSHI
tara:strand:- start:3642 stop:5258 length:1617 start_codon:yes stop_codon:yes gene_type:complete